MSFRPLDTTSDAWAVFRAAQAAMGPEGRFLSALESSEWIRELTRTGIRMQHPEYGPRQVELALLRRIYGSGLVREAFPGEDLPE